jgi:hypothetical protein
MSALREFLRIEAAGGFLPLGAVVLALILRHRPLAWLHNGIGYPPLYALGSPRESPVNAGVDTARRRS